MHELNKFMQLVSTFAYVYFKDISAPLESICYLGPHVWYIKENEIKASKTKKEEKKQLGQIQTQYAKVLLSNVLGFERPINTVMCMLSAFS